MGQKTISKKLAALAALALLCCSAMMINSNAHAQTNCMCIGEDLPGMDSLIPYVSCTIVSETCPATSCSDCRYIGIQSLLGDSCCFNQFNISSDSGECFSICSIMGTPIANFPWTSTRDTTCGIEPLILTAPDLSHRLCGFNGCVCSCKGTPPPCTECSNPLLLKVCGTFPMTLHIVGIAETGEGHIATPVRGISQLISII